MADVIHRLDNIEDEALIARGELGEGGMGLERGSKEPHLLPLALFFNGMNQWR